MKILGYQSQMGIQNASGGQSGGYQHPSAFMSAGQERLPHDLSNLSKGLSQLGGAMHQIGIERRQEVMELDLLKTVQDRSAEMSAFMDEYMENNQGRDAMEAESAFAEFGQKIVDEEMGRWAGNKKAQHYLQGNLGGLLNRGVDSMRGYSTREHEKYKDTVFAGEQQIFMSIAQDWRSSPAEVRRSFLELAPKLAGYYTSKGLDPTAAQLKAEDAYKEALGTNIFNRMLQYTDDNPDEILRIRSGKPRAVSLPKDISIMAESVAKEVGIEVDLLQAVISTESAGQIDAVSPKGAKGLMQLMPETQKELEAKYGISGDTPEGNMKLGALYLKELLERYKGDARYATSAYNWGMGNVDSYLKNGHGLKTASNPQGVVPTETENYVQRILGEDDALARQVLSPEQWDRIENRAHASIRKREIERERVVKAITGNMNNALQWAATEGDFSHLRGMEQRLLDVGAVDEAEQLSEAINMQEQTHAIVANHMESFEGRIGALQSWYEGKYSVDNAVAVQKAYDNTLESLDKQHKAFLHDPAGYVAGHELLQDENMNQEERIAVSAKLQRDIIGDSPLFVPRVTTSLEAKGIEKTFLQTESAVDKVELLEGLTISYGTRAMQVAKEAGLPPTVVGTLPLFGAENLPLDVKTRLMSAATMTDKQLGIEGDERRDAKKTVDADEFAEASKKMAQVSYFDKGQQEANTAIQETLVRYVAMGGNINSISGAFDIVEGHDHILIGPRGTFPRDTDLALAESKRKLVEELTGDKDKQLFMRFAINNATWVYDHGAQEFALVGASGVIPIEGGKPFTVNLKDVKAFTPKMARLNPAFRQLVEKF